MSESEDGRILQPDEFHLVYPGLRAYVQAEWAEGREVPYSVIYLDNGPMTPEEEEYCRELVRAGL